MKGCLRFLIRRENDFLAFWGFKKSAGMVDLAHIRFRPEAAFCDPYGLVKESMFMNTSEKFWLLVLIFVGLISFYNIFDANNKYNQAEVLEYSSFKHAVARKDIQSVIMKGDISRERMVRERHLSPRFQKM